MIDGATFPLNRPRKQSADILRKIIEASPLSSAELGRKLGYKNRSKIGDWLAYRTDIDASKVEDIIRFTAAGEEDANDLRATRLPALYLEGWLERLPEEKRAGALLCDIRERAGYTQEKFGELLGYGHTNKSHKNIINYMERGVRQITKQCVDTLPTAIPSLTQGEMDRFIAQVNISNPIIHKNNSPRCPSANLGAVYIHPVHPTLREALKQPDQEKDTLGRGG